MLSSASQKSNQKKSHVTFSYTLTIVCGELSPTHLQFTFPSAKSTKENGEKEEDENSIGSEGSREARQHPPEDTAITAWRLFLCHEGILPCLPSEQHSAENCRHISEQLRETGLRRLLHERVCLARQVCQCKWRRRRRRRRSGLLWDYHSVWEEMQTEDRAGETVLWSMQQVGKNEGAALLHSLGNALSHLFSQLGSPLLPKPITIPSSHAWATGGVLENAANSFLNLLCGTRLFSLGKEDAVRDTQLVENIRNEMSLWRGEGRAAVEGLDAANGVTELFCEERKTFGTVSDV
ncbi:uncharacterized protein MONOS_16722 [Monocercomonoides exilis]|uniref:uncharacterized protein n=1 Tax=Monocercomonoides exilis TaxID=2049356 RepID=UPI003559CBD3|nr:hypothetical protein MONOS_16722 [Monocercomonoides exilis]|eukprot:MONOS_16722.1-p1 / transcript=MONOS_16722.1 / gene=MONOS_16722 / organism=Monocercomonoides_exilis_PA203 / gene_product=unspecified product / transcript_product=unspecified product / location=Mono_scaffold02069:408-1286(-) / protein_length=293 / sequence_SO=supercontig / SO=protein_coding / is_pseudo=false